MRCPVRAECAAHALAVREPYGVWGGLTEDEREELMGRARNRLITAAPPTASVASVASVTSMTTSASAAGRPIVERM